MFTKKILGFFKSQHNNSNIYLIKPERRNQSFVFELTICIRCAFHFLKLTFSTQETLCCLMNIMDLFANFLFVCC